MAVFVTRRYPWRPKTSVEICWKNGIVRKRYSYNIGWRTVYSGKKMGQMLNLSSPTLKDIINLTYIL